MAKSYKVSVFAGTKVVADMAQQVKNATIEASIQLKTIKGGATSATPTILAPGPTGQNRKMEDVVGWFVNGTATNPPVATGTPWEAPAGNKNTNWWNGTTWSLASSIALPKGQGLLALFDPAKVGGYAKDAQVRDANGVIYVSLKDGNTSALSVEADWGIISSKVESLYGTNTNASGSQKLITDTRDLNSYEDISSTLALGTVTVNPVGSTATSSVSTTVESLKIDAAQGDVFSIKAQGGSSNRAWAFLGADDKVLSISAQGDVNDLITAPPFTKKLVVNNIIAQKNRFVLKIKGINSLVYSAQKKASDNDKKEITKQYDFKDIIAKQWYANNNSIVEQDITGNAVYNSGGIAIDVEEGDIFQIFTYSSNTRRPYYFVDNTGAVLSYSTTYGDNIDSPVWAVAPAGSKKMYVNIINSQGYLDTLVTLGFKVIKLLDYKNETSSKLKKYIPLIDTIGESFGHNVKFNTLYNTNQLTINESTDRIYDANLASCRIACQEGDIFIIGGKGGHTGRLYCFGSSNGSLFQKEPEYKAVSNVDLSIVPTVIKAPANASVLFVNVNIDSPFKIVKISKSLLDIVKFNTETAVAQIDSKAQSAINTANTALQVANNASKDVNYNTYNIGSGFEWFFNNCVSRADYMLSRQILSAKANKMIDQNKVNLKTIDQANGGSIFFMHDSTVQYYPIDGSNGKVFCFTLANDADTGDSATYPNAYVTLISMSASSLGVFNTATYQKIVVAKRNDIIDGVTIKSGCGVPNSYLVGDILHLIFSAQGTDNIWYEFHAEYNCITSTLSGIQKCKIGVNDMTCSNIASYIGQNDNLMISINASIADLNGWYYACVCAQAAFKKGVIIRTQNFKDWEFVAEPKIQMTSNAQFEGAMGAINGNLFLALRQLNSDHLIFLKMDALGNILEEQVIPGKPSRANFFKRGTTELHLAFSSNSFGGIPRLNTVIMRVDPVNLKDSIPMQDVPFYGNYLAVAPRSMNLQFISFTTGTTGVNLSSMNYGQKSAQDVMTAVMISITI